MDRRGCWVGVDLHGAGGCFRPPGALGRESCQPLAVKVEVDEGEVRAQPVMVLRDASIPHLVEAEDALQDAEDMFYLMGWSAAFTQPAAGV